MKEKQRTTLVLLWFFAVILLLNHDLAAQITKGDADSLFDPSLYDPEIDNPSYPYNKGPLIHLDEGHHNRHTYGGLGSFIAFKRVLSKDGYQVSSFKDQLTARNLKEIRLLVISCAQNEKNLWPDWYNPTYPALKRSEVEAILNWVEQGGSLFLIIDHHPFPGAVQELAMKFGFRLYNGHAEDTLRYPGYYHRANNSLHSNIITEGRDPSERIDSIITFSGSAIRIPDDASPIITFNEGWVQWLPDTAWNLEDVEPESISGLAQGAYMNYGRGKLVIFADANMFSAQDTDWGGKMGFFDPDAKYNYKLLLNIIHYLDGLLD